MKKKPITIEALATWIALNEELKGADD